MSFLNDMKKLFFAKKSVAKSAAKKSAEEIKEASEEGYDVMKGFGEDVAEKANKTLEDVKKYMSRKKESDWDAPEEEIVPDGKKSPGAESDTVDPISESMKQASGGGRKNPHLEELKKTGKETLDKAVETSDKFWEKAEDVGKKAGEEGLKLGKKVEDKARDIGEKISDKLDEMVEKAEKLDKTIEEERRAMDADGDGFADTPTHEKLRQQGSLLKDKDDFWSKAEKFAEGDYSMGQARVVGKDDSVKKSDSGNIKGFDDADGDGDSLVDDAIVVDDEDVDDDVTKLISDSDEDVELLPPADDESE